MFINLDSFKTGSLTAYWKTQGVTPRMYDIKVIINHEQGISRGEGQIEVIGFKFEISYLLVIGLVAFLIMLFFFYKKKKKRRKR